MTSVGLNEAVASAHAALQRPVGFRLLGKGDLDPSLADRVQYSAVYSQEAVLDGSTLPYDPRLFIAPGLAFRLSRDLHGGCNAADAMAAIELILPCLLVAGPSSQADCALQEAVHATRLRPEGRFVFALGNSSRMSGDDLRLCGVSLELRGEPLVCSAGAAALGNPINVLVALAAGISADGHQFRAGDLAVTAPLAPFHEVEEGGAYELRVNGLGSARLFIAVGGE